MEIATATADRPTAIAYAGMPRWARLGVLFGLLSATSIVLFGPIGVSGTYPRLIGALIRRIDPSFAASNPYLVKMGTLVTPETLLVVGLVIGAFIASRIGGAGRKAARPPAATIIHANERTTNRRYVNAFLGGVLILFGARLAGGCTSGHIISGITQLSVASIIFAVGVFAAGIVTAKSMREAN